MIVTARLDVPGVGSTVYPRPIGPDFPPMRAVAEMTATIMLCAAQHIEANIPLTVTIDIDGKVIWTWKHGRPPPIRITYRPEDIED